MIEKRIFNCDTLNFCSKGEFSLENCAFTIVFSNKIQHIYVETWIDKCNDLLVNYLYTLQLPL